jgi:hypothetical protein
LNLNNSTSFTQPFYAPPGEGEQSADFDDDSNEPLLEGELDISDMLGEGDGENPDGDEINDDGEDFLTQFYKKGKDEEDDESGDDEEDAGDSPEAQAAIAEGIKAGINGLMIPESAIPDDFDASDRKQLVGLLTTIQKDTVQQTMKIMWDPIAAALKQTHVRMRQEWKAGIGDGVKGSQREQLLSQMIPNHASPGVSDVVNTLMARAKKRFPDDVRSQVLSTKKAMLSLGMKISAPASGGNKKANQRRRGGTGSILDNFAKLPAAAFGETDKPGNRLANRLKK